MFYYTLLVATAVYIPKAVYIKAVYMPLVLRMLAGWECACAAGPAHAKDD